MTFKDAMKTKEYDALTAARVSFEDALFADFGADADHFRYGASGLSGKAKAAHNTMIAADRAFYSQFKA